MPVYEFQCEACGEITDHVASIKDVDEVKTVPCKKCGEPARRILSTFKYRFGRGGQAMRIR